MTEARLPRIVGRIAIILAAVALAWLATRACAQRMLDYGQPATAAAFTPPDGDSLANLALARIDAQGGTVDATSRTLYRQALDRAPLSAMALALAALDANDNGDQPLARRLMEAARHRDPRVVLARIWLFNTYMQLHEIDLALDEIQPIARLRSSAYNQIREVMKALVLTADGRAALRRKLAQNPDWRLDLLASVMADPAAQQSGLALFLTLPPSPDPNQASVEQGVVLNTLIARGDASLAYDTWLQLLPRQFATRTTALYDGRFAGWPGPPPFNWTLSSNENGNAEMVRDTRLPGGTGLAVHFFGTAPLILAWQYLRLQPGSYNLTGVVRRDVDGGPVGQLEASITCGDRRVGNLSLAAAGAAPQRFAARFTVAPECTLARLQIVGSPGDALGTISAQLTDLQVTR